MTRFSPPPWPNYTEEEIEAVAAVLRSGKVNYWTGSVTREFEDAFATWCWTNHAIAVANGTVALELCLAGLGIGARYGGNSTDEVIVTPRSFIASASVIANAGARPRFVDVGADSQNIDPATVKDAICANTKAIICVHLAGWPCDMDAIRSACESRDIKLIEDCAQAHGALYKGRPVGGLGDVAAWSFCQDKIMTTGGEGGMVTCNDEVLWKHMWSIKDHGKDFDAVHAPAERPGFRWLHDRFGTNWRLTEMQSAIGLIQLQRMSEWSAERQRNAQILSARLEEFASADGPVRLPEYLCRGCAGDCSSKGCRHAWYRFYLFVRPDNLKDGWSRDDLVAALQEQGVPCMQGSCAEIYLEKAFDGDQSRPETPLPVAHLLGEDSIAFLVHPTIDKVTMGAIADAAADVISRAASHPR
ncbi:MAG: DegT/DnrJ/EryC1/StrS family aminotransferase [Candidatus Puniceispirillaceae bacterium]